MKTALRLAGALVLAVLPQSLRADTVTLPVAASVTGQGGVPFVSDVRVFNTSYTDVLSVTAVYRFNGRTEGFSLQPREARAFDDICANFFSTPQSLGAVEFSINGSADEFVVTSQLRSPVDGGGFVGMFVPGLPSSAASVVSVLTSLVNGPSRTNVGVYNPNGVAVTATIQLFDGSVLLGTVSVPLGPHAVVQKNNIYDLVRFGSLVRTDGYATVESSDSQSPLFTYAAEADNHSGDLILIVGAADLAAPPGFNPPTPTATPTPPGGAVHVVNIGQFGTSYTDTVSNTSISTIHVGDTIKWVWLGGPHSTTAGTCTGGGPGYEAAGCDSDGKWESGVKSPSFTFSYTFTAAGTYRYFCDVHLDSMTGVIQVQP
jgi:plastocyanin